MTDLEARLENWGFVMRDPKRYTTLENEAGKQLVYYTEGRCRSIESSYIRENNFEDLETRRTPSSMFDRRDAEVVESAWRMIPQSTFKQILRMHYVRKDPFRLTCRELKIEQSKDFRQYRDVLHQARQALDAALQSEKKVLDMVL